MQPLLRAFSEICRAIALAHSKGVIHRDLKPANIMLGEYGEVYVLDWGVARVLGELESLAGARELAPAQRDTQIGDVPTPGYGAEQEDALQVERPADVYRSARSCSRSSPASRIRAALAPRENLHPVIARPPAGPTVRPAGADGSGTDAVASIPQRADRAHAGASRH
jgi:serine/threonine protein kinase